MPRAVNMSWEGHPGYRWVKMFRGSRYRVSCQELGAITWTKEFTVQLANEWWARKRIEIEGGSADGIILASQIDSLPELSGPFHK